MPSFRTVFFDEPMFDPTPPLVLRRPQRVFAAGAVALMFGVGLTLALATISGLAIEPPLMAALALPVLAATLASTLMLGPALHRRELRHYSGLVVRVAMIWALFGLAWPALFAIADVLDTSYALQDPGLLRDMALAFAKVGLAGLAIGGLSGAAAAIIIGAVCLKRV